MKKLQGDRWYSYPCLGLGLIILFSLVKTAHFELTCEDEYDYQSTSEN